MTFHALKAKDNRVVTPPLVVLPMLQNGFYHRYDCGDGASSRGDTVGKVADVRMRLGEWRATFRSIGRDIASHSTRR